MENSEESTHESSRLRDNLPRRDCSLSRQGQDNQAPAQGDFIIRNFKFDSGEVLPELKLHYRTLASPHCDASGIVRNAVLVMHGTGGSVGGFMSTQFAGVLFRSGQLLDATKYFIIFPVVLRHRSLSYSTVLVAIFAFPLVPPSPD
ncbi:MAG TPA: hypothetical protein VLG74_00695 [Blastocatellia bacterium]|nr:hypothetical protein [Blastocatellia bacterium]